MIANAEINAILKDEAFRHSVKTTVDELTGMIRLYADAGIDKDVTVEMLIGFLQKDNLMFFSGAVRVIAGKVYARRAWNIRREKIEDLFGKMRLWKRTDNPLERR